MSSNEICIKKIFTLEEANEMIPLFDMITRKCEATVEDIMKDQRWLIKSGAAQERVTECDNKVGRQLVEWGTKMAKLGCQVYGQGYIGLDSGSFFWSWHRGEDKIRWVHHYDELPFQRRPFPLVLIGGSIVEEY